MSKFFCESDQTLARALGEELSSDVADWISGGIKHIYPRVGESILPAVRRDGYKLVCTDEEYAQIVDESLHTSDIWQQLVGRVACELFRRMPVPYSVPYSDTRKEVTSSDSLLEVTFSCEQLLRQQEIAVMDAEIALDHAATDEERSKADEQLWRARREHDAAGPFAKDLLTVLAEKPHRAD